jgi:hypothetical protein
MKNKVFIVLACLVSYGTVAQNNSPKKYKFESINSLILLNGDHNVAPAIQTINGLSKGPWFTGIGVGIDYYQYRTIPLFADIRYDFAKKNLTRYFAYGDAGINFQWVEESFYNDPSIWNPTSNDFKNGMYADIGVGINAGFKNGNAIVLSLGYMRKTMKEMIYHSDWRTGEPQKDVNSYRFNTIALKLGFKFG